MTLASRRGAFGGAGVALLVAACDIATYGLTDDGSSAATIAVPTGIRSTGNGGFGSVVAGGAGGGAENGGAELTDQGTFWFPGADPFTVSRAASKVAGDLALFSFLCGDGIRDPVTEECDDGGDLEPLDLCTVTCQLEDALVEVQALADNDAPFHERAPLGRRLGHGRHPVAAGPDGFAVAYVEEPTPAAVANDGGASDAPFVGIALYDFPPPRYFNALFEHRDPQPLVNVSAGTSPLLAADPVVAGLADGSYAVAYTSFGDDGDALGVVLRRLTPSSAAAATLGAVTFASAETFASQYDADLLPLPDGNLLVAWADDRDPFAGPDLYYRLFSSALTPLGEVDTPLADSLAAEGHVALASFGAGWAAAWRASAAEPTAEPDDGGGAAGAAGAPAVETPSAIPAGDPRGREVLEVELEDGTHFTVLETSLDGELVPFLPGPDEDRPAIVQVSPAHLLVLFTVGTDPEATGVADVGRLRMALLDIDEPGAVPAYVVPFSAAVNDDPTRSQSHPSATVVGDPTSVLTDPELAGQLFLAWRSAADASDPVDAAGLASSEDAWLMPVWVEPAGAGSEHVFEVDGVSLALVLGEELRLPRFGVGAHGDQRSPALAAATAFAAQTPPYDTLGALVAAYEDFGREHATAEGEPDVVVELLPLPLLPRTDRTGQCGTEPAEQCGIGEGHCESDDECEEAPIPLVCAEPPAATAPADAPYGLGPNFGLGPELAVCVPEHCTNGVQDAPSQPSAPNHEDGIDCGGSHCGDCFGCGDGVLQWMLAELCDDGNTLAGDGCDATCQSDETCGNGVVDAVTGEECDDGNLDDDDDCTATCKLHRCGDGIVHGAEACDSHGIATASCDVDCTLPDCGDGVLNPFAGEACEPPGAGYCSATCQAPSGCTNATSCLHVESIPDNAPNDNQLHLPIKIVNTTTASVTLTNYRLRYWAAKDPCDPAVPNCTIAVQSSYGSTSTVGTLSPSRSRADRYVDLRFNYRVLAPGVAFTFELVTYQTGWPSVNDANDYSFPPSPSAAYTPNPRITLYTPGGSLVWGTEPGQPLCGDGQRDPGEACDAHGATPDCDADCTAAVCGDGTLNPAAGELCDLGPDAPSCTYECEPSFCGDGLVHLPAGELCDVFLTPTCRTPDCDGFLPGHGCTNSNICLKVQSHPEGLAADGQIEPYVRIVNNGPDAVPVSDLTLRYWFTLDGRDPAGITRDCYYLEGMSCGIQTTSIDLLTVPLDGADAYYELSLPTSTAVIQRTGSLELKTAFHLPPEWPPFDETDDYSYLASSTYVDNTHIALYRDGELVWGDEPGPVPYCGDYATEPPEECDDGGESALCDGDCTFPACGDAEANAAAGETCDDGNDDTETACAYGTPTCTGCSADCATELDLVGPYCGDGIVQTNSGEQCDPAVLGSTCLPDCTTPPTTCTTSATCLHVLSKRGNNDASNNGTIVPFIELVNPTAQAIPLAELAVRYWFTGELPSPLPPSCGTNPALAVSCYWASLDQASWDNVCATQVARSFTLLAPARTGATHYFELTFPNAPALGAGRRTGELQHGINKCDWSNFNETNDYSWRTDTAYVVNTKITIYRNGLLIWGNEP